MPQNLGKEKVNIGDVVYRWSVKEYQKQNHDKHWYIFMIVAGLFFVIYGILSSNYLFSLIIALFGIIVFLADLRDPLNVPFAITNIGIVVGSRFYRFSELKNFWIIYNPPEVKNLYFSFDNFFKHRLQISLEDYDPRPMREFLNQYLEEDMEQEEEPISDRISRMFHLH